MKKLILLSGLCLFFVSCSDESGTEVEALSENRILMLEVDLETNTFKGGVEFSYPELAGFTITTDYSPPGDFGDITLKYQEADSNLFAGTIVWAGSGERTYPETLNASNLFITETIPSPMPGQESFELVSYGDFGGHYPETIDYSGIWDAIDNLKRVKEFRAANPAAKVHLFLYTPSVGIGNPAEWSWYVFIRN